MNSFSGLSDVVSCLRNKLRMYGKSIFNDRKLLKQAVAGFSGDEMSDDVLSENFSVN